MRKKNTKNKKNSELNALFYGMKIYNAMICSKITYVTQETISYMFMTLDIQIIAFLETSSACSETYTRVICF